jgi:hypothetical protein
MKTKGWTKKKGKRYWWWLYLDGKRIYFCLYLFQRRAPYLSFHTSLCVWGFLLDCSMYFYINKIRESGGKRHVIRLLVPQADVNFACTRHSLSCCLHTKSSLYNKSPKTSSVIRTRMHSQFRNPLCHQAMHHWNWRSISCCISLYKTWVCRFFTGRFAVCFESSLFSTLK